MEKTDIKFQRVCVMNNQVIYNYKKTQRIMQVLGKPRISDLEKYNQLIIVIPKKESKSIWNLIPQGKKIKELIKNYSKGSSPAITSRLKNTKQTSLHIGLLDSELHAFDRLAFSRDMIKSVTQEKAGSLAIWVLGFEADFQKKYTEEILSAALVGQFILPTFKSKSPTQKITSISLIGHHKKIITKGIVAESDGNNLTRWLTALPSNKLDAVSYINLIEQMSNDFNWEIDIFRSDDLKKMEAGAFLAVSQGNDNDSAAIVKLKYKPSSIEDPKLISLIGKGIIFDTGGTNLKPFNSMLEMHIDMNGSAVALGSLLAITKQKLPIEVDCWLAITENRTGPLAYKSQDVVKAANGKTIQTIHTDAEGRMVLADTLYFAGQEKPDFMIDFATLTGTCVSALTNNYSGVFTNQRHMQTILKEIGEDCGERVWPFPIGSEFLVKLRSETADLMQCAPAGGGDHILAATFLNEFVEEDIPWVHIDLSSANSTGGLAHVPTKITGFGVRYLLNILKDKRILDNNTSKSL